MQNGAIPPLFRYRPLGEKKNQEAKDKGMYQDGAGLSADLGRLWLVIQQMNRRVSGRQRQARQSPHTLQIFTDSFEEGTTIEKRTLQAPGWLAHCAPPPPLRT